MNKNPIIKLILGLLLLGALAYVGFRVMQNKSADKADSADAKVAEKKALYWYDPMVPDQHFDNPGKSPFMDMELVAKYADESSASGASQESSIAVDPNIVQTLGIRLAEVTEGPFMRAVDTVGNVTVDEHGIEDVQVRMPGWVEQLNVRAAGDPVKRGQLLAAVYSPDLLAIQQEFLLALSSNNADLISAGRERMSLFGLSAGQISRIEKSRKPERRINYYAPFDGYVVELGARQGSSVNVDTKLFQLANLSKVWVNAEVPEAQGAWIKTGDRAAVEVSALPGERFEGTVDYVYPELMASTRTIKMRIIVNNSARHLRPGMFASAHMKGVTTQKAMLVPTEAVIKTGTRSVVIVADDKNHFHPALVRIGSEYEGKSEVLEGLSLGQTVVASGQFLIDSEANLRGAFNNLTGDSSTPANASEQMPAPSMKGH